MEIAEYKKQWIRNRKSNKLCIGCGKSLDRDGVYCIACREKINKATKETRAWYQSNGICPRCGKVSLMGDEKNCPECRAKFANAATRAREKNRDEWNERQKIIQRNIYSKRKDQGVCTRCGKRKADSRHKTCEMCRAKLREYKRIKYGTGSRFERVEHGLCYFCGNPVKKGYKVCEKHYQINLQNLNNDKCIKARENFKKIEYRRIKSKKQNIY